MSVPMTIDGRRWLCALAPDPAPVPEGFVVYGQRDPAWSQRIYAGSTTFASAGCLVTSLAMVATHVCGSRIDPVETAARLRDAGAFVGALLSKPHRIPAAFPLLTWDGVRHFRDKPADMAMIASFLASDGPVIAEVAFNPKLPVVYTDSTGKTKWNQHFLVIVAVDGDEAIAADPWENKLGPLTESRYWRESWPKRADRVITGVRLIGIRHTTGGDAE